MQSFENIEGPKLNTIFRHLVLDRIFVKVSLPHSSYESLTLVDQPLHDSARQSFHIDPPKGLIETIAKSNASLLHFEFTSDDGVIHRFDSEIRNISAIAIALHYPPYIQRHQMRDNFRVKVIPDSFVKVVIGEEELRMGIENLSLGGVYCYCLTRYKSQFSSQQLLNGLEIYLTMANDCHVVPIKRAQVKRIETKPRPKHFGIAFEFVRLQRHSKKILVQQIYELQRQILQNRLKILE